MMRAQLVEAMVLGKGSRVGRGVAQSKSMQRKKLVAEISFRTTCHDPPEGDTK